MAGPITLKPSLHKRKAKQERAAAGPRPQPTASACATPGRGTTHPALPGTRTTCGGRATRTPARTHSVTRDGEAWHSAHRTVSARSAYHPSTSTSRLATSRAQTAPTAPSASPNRRRLSNADAPSAGSGARGHAGAPRATYLRRAWPLPPLNSKAPSAGRGASPPSSSSALSAASLLPPQATPNWNPKHHRPVGVRACTKPHSVRQAPPLRALSARRASAAAIAEAHGSGCGSRRHPRRGKPHAESRRLFHSSHAIGREALGERCRHGLCVLSKDGHAPAEPGRSARRLPAAHGKERFGLQSLARAQRLAPFFVRAE